MIGTNAAKDTLLGRLAMLPTQQRPEERWWHLPADLPDSWFEQMAAERKDPETDCWVPVKANVRNEAINVSVYAWAVAHLPKALRLGTMRERDWCALEELIQPRIADLFSAAPAPTSTQPGKKPATPRQPPVRRRAVAGAKDWW